MRFKFGQVGNISLYYVSSTDAPGLHPDLGPGMADDRDEYLDEEATGEPGEDCQETLTPAEEQAARDVDDSIACALARVGL